MLAPAARCARWMMPACAARPALTPLPLRSSARGPCAALEAKVNAQGAVELAEESGRQLAEAVSDALDVY